MQRGGDTFNKETDLLLLPACCGPPRPLSFVALAEAGRTLPSTPSSHPQRFEHCRVAQPCLLSGALWIASSFATAVCSTLFRGSWSRGRGRHLPQTTGSGSGPSTPGSVCTAWPWLSGARPYLAFATATVPALLVEYPGYHPNIILDRYLVAWKVWVAGPATVRSAHLPREPRLRAMARSKCAAGSGAGE